MSYPSSPSNKGKRCTGRKPEGGHFRFTIVDEFHIRQSKLPSKLIYLQRIKFDSDNRIELRLGYYVIGKKPKMRGRWVWGQFATMIPASDFRRLVRIAIKKRWF